MINPAKYAEAGTEHAHQTALMIWASLPETRQRYPELGLLYAIPNGGTRDRITAGRLRAEGVKSGVPDLCLPVARHGVHGLYIELKRPPIKSVTLTGRKMGVVSDNQKKWIAALLAEGYGALVCWGWEQARDVLIQYLSKVG